MGIKKHIPNTITCLNLLAGTIAVIFALKGWQVWAVYLIMAAAVFDFFDGFAARLLKAYSPMGKELDSLADLISFGLAPSFLLYYKYSQVLSPYIHGNNYTILYELLALSPLVITIGSALRLAKFNVDVRQSENFIGLPTPANALLISMFIYFTTYSVSLDQIIGQLVFIPIMSVILSYILVCEVPMFSMKFKSLKWDGNQERIVFLSFVAILGALIIVIGQNWSLWLLIVFITYILINFSLYFSKRLYLTSE